MPLENLPDVKDTKKLLNKLTPDAPLPFAFTPGEEKKVPAILLLHLTKAGKALFELIKKETGLKEGTFGSARIVDEVLHLDCEKRLAGVRKDVRGYIKANTPMPVKDVRIFVEGVEVVEREEGGSDLPVKPSPNPEGGSPEGKPELDPEQLKRFVEAYGRFRIQALEVKKNSPGRFPEFVGYLNDLGNAIKSRNLKDCETAMQKAVNFADDALKVDAPSSTGAVSQLEKDALVERLKELSVAYKKALPGLEKGEAESIGKEIRELIATAAPGGKVANLTAANYEKALGQVDRLVLRVQQALARPTEKKDFEEGGKDFSKLYDHWLPRETALGPYARGGIEAQGLKAKRLAEGGNMAAGIHETEAWGVLIDAAEKRVLQLAGQVDTRVQQLGPYVGEGIRKLAKEVRSELQGVVTLRGTQALYALEIQLVSAERDKKRQADLAMRLKGIAPSPESLKMKPEDLKKLSQDTDKGGLKGHGSEFSAVLKHLNAVNSDPSPKNLDALEKAARAYMAEADKQYNKLSDEKKKLKDQDVKSDLKYKTSEDMLRLVDRYRSIALSKEQQTKLPPPPWSKQQEQQAVGLEARLNTLAHGSKQLSGDDGAGASQSFFIKDGAGKNAFLAKPSKGEHVPTDAWKPGGGAVREAMLSSVNEYLVESIGLDLGVCQTSLTVLEGSGLGGLASVQRVAPVNQGFDDMIMEKTGTPDMPVKELQQIQLLDFLTLNLDRQKENILVNKDANTGRVSCTPIDAGFALPGRKAYKQNKSAMTGSAVSTVAKQGDRKFDPSLLDALDRLDADKYAAQMREANRRLEGVDPSAKGMIEDESIEMCRRSVLFLKALAREFTTDEIAVGYSMCFEPVLDAKPEQVDRAIQAAIVELREQLSAKRELHEMELAKTMPKLELLGWSVFPESLTNNYKNKLDVAKNAKPNPAKVKQREELLRQVGGVDKLPPKYAKNFDQENIANQITSLRKGLAALKLADPSVQKAMTEAGADPVRFDIDSYTVDLADMWSVVEGKGGKELAKLNKTMPGTPFEQKAFELAGGEKRLAEANRYFRGGGKPYKWEEDPEKLAKQVRNYYLAAFRFIREFDEFERLGGFDVIRDLDMVVSNEKRLDIIIDEMKTNLALKK